MTKYVAQSLNKTALFLSQFHTSFEESIASIGKFDYHRVLKIQNDPVSTQHVVVFDIKHPLHKFRVEKRDIDLANQNPQSLYVLLSNVLNHLKTDAVVKA